MRCRRFDRRSLAGRIAETAALGVHPEEDRWARYAFKLATGAGKTKVMSLAIVWSYFHALRESDSPMARHFVVIAPNLTVFERLKEDFKPARRRPDIFDRDPLIPVAWRGDWNLYGRAAGRGERRGDGRNALPDEHPPALRHQRTANSARRRLTTGWGRRSRKAKALDTGAALRARITSTSRG